MRVVTAPDDSAALIKNTTMKAEVENALRRTLACKYLVEACKADPDLAGAVEAAYADGVRVERAK